MGDRTGPLTGIRVLELGNLIAAPTAGRIFAEFGAEVIKVERPHIGDELRAWRRPVGDTSLLFRTIGRGKKSITVDLRHPQGRELILKLVAKCDVVLENFRPGTLERLGLGPNELRKVAPNIILVRISGYGQTGPYRDRPGFASVAEAMGGLRHLTGHPDQPPVRVGVSLGDTLAGLYGALGAVMAIVKQLQDRAQGRTTSSEIVDVALYEAVFSVLEDLIPEHDGYGVRRARSGSALAGIVPSNTYGCRDGEWVIIGGNGDAIFRRLMVAVDRADLANDPGLSNNAQRIPHREMIDRAISEWTMGRSIDSVIEILEKAQVPVGRIYSAAEILTDPHFESRNMLVRQEVELAPGCVRDIVFPGVVPKLTSSSEEPVAVGPDLGAHNDEVFTELLGISEEEVGLLRAAAVL